MLLASKTGTGQIIFQTRLHPNAAARGHGTIAAPCMHIAPRARGAQGIRHLHKHRAGELLTRWEGAPHPRGVLGMLQTSGHEECFPIRGILGVPELDHGLQASRDTAPLRLGPLLWLWWCWGWASPHIPVLLIITIIVRPVPAGGCIPSMFLIPIRAGRGRRRMSRILSIQKIHHIVVRRPIPIPLFVDVFIDAYMHTASHSTETVRVRDRELMLREFLTALDVTIYALGYAFAALLFTA